MPSRPSIQKTKQNHRFLSASLLSVGVHALLFFGLFQVFQWQTNRVEVYAELWAPELSSNGIKDNGNRQKVVAKDTRPPVQTPPPAPAKKVIEKAPKPKVDPEAIALAKEKARLKKQAQEEAKRLAEKRKAQALAKKRELERQRRLKEAKIREAKRREAQLQEMLRQEELARLDSVSKNTNHSTSGNPTVNPNNLTQSLSASQANRWQSEIVACVRPHISIDVPKDVKAGQYVAIFEVNLLPTAQQSGLPIQKKNSGWGAYDRAVKSAIQLCNPFPKPEIGAVPRTITLTFDPIDQQ